MVEYNDVTHEYRDGNIFLPSVTQIIPKQQFWCTDEQLEAARIDGENRHKMMKIFIGTLDTFGDPFLIALDDFLKKELAGQKVLLNEKPLASKKYLFAGTPDLIMSGCIIDLKRSFGNARHHALQLAGYSILAEENEIGKTNVHLIIRWTGKKIVSKNVYNDQARAVFLSLVKKFYIEKEYKNYMEKVKR